MKRALKVLFVVIALVAAIGAMSGCFVRAHPVQPAPVYVARPAAPPPTVVYSQPAPAPAPVYVAPQPAGPPPPTLIY